MKNKRIYKLFLMAILGISSLFIAGAKVKADGTGPVHLENPRMYCDPAAIEAGKRAECFMIGDIKGNTAVTGYIIEFVTTEGLSLKAASVNSNVKSSASAAIIRKVEASATTNGAPSDAPQAVKDFRCGDLNEATPADVRDMGCVLFYAKDGTSDPFTETSLIRPKDLNANVAAKLTSDAVGVLGSLTVELDASWTNQKCGDICFAVWVVPDPENYENFKTCQNGDPNAEECNPTPSYEKRKCEQITLKEGTPQVETGSFVSYTILIAGILLAICAVAIAKKNNRLQKI